MRRIIIIISLLLSPAAANAVDSFDLSTSQLSIPQVIAGDTKYFDLIVTISALVSGGELTSPLATTNLGPRPDTFDLKRNQLIIPAVTVDNTVYKNLIVTIGEVVSFGGETETLSSSVFNGEVYPEPYELNVGSDLPQSVGEGIRAVLDAAVGFWGNFGPMEYWIVGSDSSATRDLETQFCDRRVERDQLKREECNGFLQSGGGLFESYRQITADAMKEVSPGQSVGLNGLRTTGGNAFNLIVGSLPLSFSNLKFPGHNNDEIKSSGQRTPIHEYWHNVQAAHIPARFQGIERQEMMGPTWFVEGSAEYLAIITLSRLLADGKLSLIDEIPYNGLKSMSDYMERGKNDLLNNPELEVRYIKSGDLRYSIGSWAVAYLLNRAGDSDILLDIFHPYVAELGWEGAFVKTFGITSDTFYAEFDAFLLLPYDEQVKILDPSLI